MPANFPLQDAPELMPANFPFEWLHESPAAAAGSASAAAVAAPLLADIEEAHQCAVDAGKLQYRDPQSGYTVFTQLQSLQRCASRVLVPSDSTSYLSKQVVT